ncbi:MAG: hypothetical protein KJP00_00900 [Bacteroidia bacterium]|nr:hypothetical protein [Bacteroidia bacterium]
MKTLIQVLAVFCSSLILITSCSKEDVNVADVENYISESVFHLERECNAGRMGCFEFVWPLTITFPDGSSGTFSDQEALRFGIQTWKEANPEATERPQLSFPLDIIDEEGTLFTIMDRDELRSIVQECRRTYFQNNGHRGHPRNSCFTIVFPVSIDFPNDGVIAFDTKEDLKAAMRDWRENNQEISERPGLVFPITIELKETEEQTVINSEEELKQLKEDCRG